MSTKKTNGDDPLMVEMIDLLREIRDQAKETNAELHALKEDVGLLREDVRAFKVDTVHALVALNHDITDIGEELRGGPTGTLKARVERLERIVLKPTGTGT